MKDSTKNRILELFTKVMPKVQERLQTINVDLSRAISPPLGSNVLPMGMLPQAELPFHRTSLANDQVSGMFSALPSSMPWVEITKNYMPPYGTITLELIE